MSKWIRNLFRTRYRVYFKDGKYVVQEHEWWDLIYGYWWHVGRCSKSLAGALEEIELEKKARLNKLVEVYRD